MTNSFPTTSVFTVRGLLPGAISTGGALARRALHLHPVPSAPVAQCSHEHHCAPRRRARIAPFAGLRSPTLCHNDSVRHLHIAIAQRQVRRFSERRRRRIRRHRHLASHLFDGLLCHILGRPPGQHIQTHLLHRCCLGLGSDVECLDVPLMLGRSSISAPGAVALSTETSMPSTLPRTLSMGSHASRNSLRMRFFVSAISPRSRQDLRERLPSTPSLSRPRASTQFPCSHIFASSGADLNAISSRRLH